MYYHSSLYSSEKSPHLQALITVGIQVPTVQLKWAENLVVPAIVMYVNSLHSLPLLITVGAQVPTVHMVKAIVMFMSSIHPLPLLITVGVQVPTVHMVKAIVMYMNSIHPLPLLITVGVQGMTMECMVIQGGTGHHPMTVQWILENLQVKMYMTIHPLQVAALQELTIVMYGTIHMSILSTVE